MSVLNKFNADCKPGRGYTLMEMILVIVVTGILAAISAPSLINWKHLQEIKTRQLALKTTLERIKSDAKRWGATCTINGATLKSSCSSAVIQKNITDQFDSQSTQEIIINPTVKERGEEKTFVATNFKTITFSPRGFIHVDPLKKGDTEAVFVLGYQSDSDPFKDQAPEQCVVVQNLTGQISVKRRDATKLESRQAIFATSGLTC